MRARGIAIDRVSLLVDVDGETTLADLETALRRDGLTLDVDASAHDLTVRAWIDRGTPGARDRWLDPADQIIAGLEAVLTDGRALTIRPAPRRAVGPDLVALVAGCAGRFAKVTRASLRVHVVGAVRPLAPCDFPRDPPLSAAESSLVDALVDAIANELTKERAT